MKKIDFHVHTMTTRMAHWRRATPEELFDIYEKLGVEKGVILPSVQQNEEAIDIVEKYPDGFIGFATSILEWKKSTGHRLVLLYFLLQVQR